MHGHSSCAVNCITGAKYRYVCMHFCMLRKCTSWKEESTSNQITSYIGFHVVIANFMYNNYGSMYFKFNINQP